MQWLKFSMEIGSVLCSTFKMCWFCKTDTGYHFLWSLFSESLHLCNAQFCVLNECIQGCLKGIKILCGPYNQGYLFFFTIIQLAVCMVYLRCPSLLPPLSFHFPPWALLSWNIWFGGMYVQMYKKSLQMARKKKLTADLNCFPPSLWGVGY